MTSAQTSYTKNIEKALLGLVADIQPMEVGSFTNETGILGFGLGVQFGSSENEAVVGSGAVGAGFLGVSIRTTTKENSVVGGEEQQYNQGETMGVLRRGSIWVALAAGGNPGDSVRVDNSTGEIDVGGVSAGFSVFAALQTLTVAGELGLIRIQDVT